MKKQFFHQVDHSKAGGTNVHIISASVIRLQDQSCDHWDIDCAWHTWLKGHVQTEG